MTDYLIDGIKILNINPPEEPISLFICIGIMIVLCFVLIGSIGLLFDFQGNIKYDLKMATVGALLVGSILGCISWTIKKKNALPETYDVLIDESVSFRVFDENYEVVERKGSIYTIKERAK